MTGSKHVAGTGLEVRDLSYKRGRRTILSKLDFKIVPQSITALLGPNGTGKSTLMQLLAGLLTTRDGSIHFEDLGPSAPEWRQWIHYVPTGGRFMERETGLTHFAFGERAYVSWSREEAYRVAAELHVPLDRPVRQLSSGQRMGLALTYAFASGARLLLLDEPSNGLDAEHKSLLYGAIAAHVADGGTVLLSSHVLPELEALADRALFLRDGMLLLDADLEELRTECQTLQVLLPDVLTAGSLETLKHFAGVSSLNIKGRTLTLELERADEALMPFIRTLGPLDIQAVPRPLTETYAHLMQPTGNGVQRTAS